MNGTAQRQKNSDDLAEKILEMALELGDARSWEKLHLYDVAASLGISLDQIREYYPQKDDLVEAWFDRADQALLRMDAAPEFFGLSQAKRLHYVMMYWFDALSTHQRLTRQMLCYKLEFGHIHLQVLGIMRISRTVQWFREAARLETANLLRVLEETGLTAIYLRSFFCWLYDDSRHFDKTRKFLRKQLSGAERAMRFFDVLRY